MEKMEYMGLNDIREKFLADVELDNSGNIKKYSSSEISDYLVEKNEDRILRY